MAHFDLSPHEAGLLSEILRSYLSDLRMEIADTELKDVRDSMKQQRDFIIGLIERLEVPESDLVECCCVEL
jgi:hypothetical protein